jgi:eukaryotic-like serine/threonine-protein kinase
MLTKAGVKVLDFGLAKISAEGETLTATDALIGTPAYMAPEQLEGKSCDARTDIYAHGLVLYEMALGKKLQRGPTPALNTLPAGFAHVLERCLASDPEQRWHSAADLRLELEWAETQQANVAATGQRSRMRRIWPVLATAAISLLAGMTWLQFRSSPGDNYRFSPFATEAAEESYPAWAPDGKTIAYFADVNGVKQIFTRTLGSPAAVQITKSLRALHEPVLVPGRDAYLLSLGRTLVDWRCRR